MIVVGLRAAETSAATLMNRLQRQVLLLSGFARRAHSIAAQGQHPTPQNYQNDENGRHRLFYDTVKVAISARVKPMCTSWRSSASTSMINAWPRAFTSLGNMAACWRTAASAARKCRERSTRGQTGQQLLQSAYQALERQVEAGRIRMFPRTEMLDLVVVDGQARGIITRNAFLSLVQSNVIPPTRCWAQAATATFLSFHQCERVQLHRHLARIQAGRRIRKPMLYSDSHRFPYQATINPNSLMGRINCETTATSGCLWRNAQTQRQPDS